MKTLFKHLSDIFVAVGCLLAAAWLLADVPRFSLADVPRFSLADVRNALVDTASAENEAKNKKEQTDEWPNTTPGEYNPVKHGPRFVTQRVTNYGVILRLVTDQLTGKQWLVSESGCMKERVN